MRPVRNRKRLLLSISLIAIGGIFILMGLFPRQSDCYIKCSPIIGVTNYKYFAELLKSMVKDRFITRLKIYFMEKINIEFMPGNYGRSMMRTLETATDFLSIAGGIVGEGLALQTDCIKTKMSPEAFREHLNGKVLPVVRKGLLQRGIDGRQAQDILNDYEKQFLNSRQTLDIYANQMLGFQTKAREFMKESAGFTSRMTDIAGHVDVADWIQGKQKTGGSTNTHEMLKECEGYAVKGLQNIGTIAGIEMGEAIGGKFAGENGRYLKAKLEEVQGPGGTASFSMEVIEKIIEDANKAAIRTVQDYIALTISDLSGLEARAKTALRRVMKKAIDSADSMIYRSMSLEREEGYAVNRLYANIEKRVKDLVGDPKKPEAIAREIKQVSLLDNEDIQKITVLLAGRGSSALQRRLAVKHYITARESGDMADAIRARLLKFDPGVIDCGYDDMAWKDLARFNYYLLVLHNQKMKLQALRAMAGSLNSADPEAILYIEKGALPRGF